MDFFKKIVSFYIDASIHVALAVYSLMRISALYLDIQCNENLNIAILLGTIFGYNYIKYNDCFLQKKKLLPLSIKRVFFFSFICLVFSLYYFYQLKLNTLMIILFFGILTVLYSIPLKFVRSLRNYPRIKISIIALVWAGVTVLLPFYDSEVKFDIIAVLYFIQRFLFIIALTIPFDIRDLNRDNTSLKTLPQLYGIKVTKKIAFVLLLFVILIEFFVSPNDYFKTIFIIIFLALNIFIQRATDKQSKYFSSFWVEALPVFWFLLLITYFF